MKDHFKDCVEWLVHNEIDPDFAEREHDVYRNAFSKVDGEALGLASSEFTSSQWVTGFIKAINARPEMVRRELASDEGFTEDGIPKCDACNRRKHPPKYAISFRGNPYVKRTLVDVEQDSDGEDDDEGLDIDEQGNDLPSEEMEWFSGRYVKSPPSSHPRHRAENILTPF